MVPRPRPPRDSPAARAAALTIAAGLVALGRPGPARADGPDGEGAIYGQAITGALLLGYAIELAIPDVRLELGPGGHRWALAFPLVVHGRPLAVGEDRALGFEHFAELQYQPAREARRFALGERLVLFDRAEPGPLAPVVEVGGLLGEDGSGGFFGAGVVLGDPELGVTFGLIGRLIVTESERRGDLAIDLQLPLGLDL